MTAPALMLTCRVCGWRPDEGLEVGDLKQHFIDEHDDGPVFMGLIAYCPRDDAVLNHRFTGVTPAGKNSTTYDCPRCQRTYNVKWSPDDLGE